MNAILLVCSYSQPQALQRCWLSQSWACRDCTSVRPPSSLPRPITPLAPAMRFIPSPPMGALPEEVPESMRVHAGRVVAHRTLYVPFVYMCVQDTAIHGNSCMSISVYVQSRSVCTGPGVSVCVPICLSAVLCTRPCV